MITKIQKLSAIHNDISSPVFNFIVVYDYKDTKIVSNSQHVVDAFCGEVCCL